MRGRGGNWFVIREKSAREEEEKRQAAGFSSMTVALGILSHATVPHRYTLLHVCSAPASVCPCFIGGFLFNCLPVLSGLGCVFFFFLFFFNRP